MPSRLVSAGAIYQRITKKSHREHNGRKMEAYVDDMVFKSIKGEMNVSDL